MAASVGKPNDPFNPNTVISYELPKATSVSLKIHDMLGREVASLVDQRQEAGVYNITWDAKGIASGVYFYRLQAGSYTETKKMMLMR